MRTHRDLLARMRRPWQPYFATPEVPAQRLHVRAADGVRLAVHRLRLPGGHKPLLLLHGLAANRLAYTFPGRSLAEWLAHRGYDCFVIELRGAGESEHPERPWDLDDYLHLDLPAVVREVQQVTGVERLPWIGHSMGGLLWLCYAMVHGETSLERGVAVGSALDYRVGQSGFRSLLPLLPWLRRFAWVPFGEAVHWLAPALGRAADPLTVFNFWPANVEPDVVRRIYARGFHAVPTSLLAALATTFSDRGLHDRQGEVFFLERAAEPSRPVLMLGGSRDAQAPLAAVAETAARLGPRASARSFGREFGHGEEYGHWDLLLGKQAVNEVWPVIHSWLEGEATAGADGAADEARR